MEIIEYPSNYFYAYSYVFKYHETWIQARFTFNIYIILVKNNNADKFYSCKKEMRMQTQRFPLNYLNQMNLSKT